MAETRRFFGLFVLLQVSASEPRKDPAERDGNKKQDNNNQIKDVQTGVIVGSIFGPLLLLLLFVTLFFRCKGRRRRPGSNNRDIRTTQ
ncbi:uncharacterized protein V6R79_013318 [Siganus canaliculatus]